MDPSPLIIGITGAIGSGKSVFGELLAKRGVAILDADRIAREVVAKGQPALEEIRARFGEEVIDPSSGELNRKLLGKIVFESKMKRLELEAILHPKIRSSFLRQLDALKQHPKPAPWIIGYVVPLLFESGFNYREIQKVVVVSAPRELCTARVMQRDHCSREDAEARIDAQLPIEEKKRRADFVVENTGDLAALDLQCDALLHSLEAAARQAPFKK